MEGEHDGQLIVSADSISDIQLSAADVAQIAVEGDENKDGSGPPVIIYTAEDGSLTAIQSDIGVMDEALNHIDQSGNRFTVTELPEGCEGEEGLEPPAKRYCVEVLTVSGNEVQTDCENEPIMIERAVQVLPAIEDDPSYLEATGESTDISQTWFTTRDDKTALQSKGHCWKQGQWTKDEVEILQQNIISYCKVQNINDPTEVIFEMSKDERKDFYRFIARGLNRPLFSVYRRVVRMYDQKNHMGKYSPEELVKLRELRTKYGSDWSRIGASLGRSASSVKDRCRLMKETCNSGKWLPEEEKRLAQSVYEMSGAKPGENVTCGLSWALVAEQVGTRSEKQCRTKWLNFLNWKQQGGTEWTREDDILLVNKIGSYGAVDETQIDWNELANDWPSVRSPQWLRGKWWSMKRHITDYQLLAFQETVETIQQLHSQNLRPRSFVRHVDDPRVSVIQHITPVSTQDGSVVQGTDSATKDSVDGFHAYEILSTWAPGSTHSTQGAYLITQPQTNPVISFATADMATDHIIVHTLPVSQGCDTTGRLEDESRMISGNSKLGDESQIIAGSSGDSHISGDSSQSQQLVHMIEQEEYQTHVTEQLIDGAALSSEDVQLETPGMVTSDCGVHNDLDSVQNDLGMVSSDSQRQNNSDLMNMSSLSDPMLPSDGLMNVTSDLEGEKTPSHDDS